MPAERRRRASPVASDEHRRQPPGGRAGTPQKLTRIHASLPLHEAAHLVHQISWVVAPRDRRRAPQDGVAAVGERGPTSAHAARKIRRARLRCTAPPTVSLAIDGDPARPRERGTPRPVRPRDGRLGVQDRLRSRASRTAAVRSRRSNGQTGAALAPPRREDRTARARAHAVTEPVHLRAATVVRLVRTLALGHRDHEPHSDSDGRRVAGRVRSIRASSLRRGVDNRKCVKTPDPA